MTKQSALATGVCLLAAALGLMAPVAFARPQETENERISRIGMAFQSATADEMAAVMAHGAMAEFIAPADIVMACGEVAAAQALVPQFDARIAATRARLIEGGDRAEDIDRYLANSLNLSTMTEAVHVRLCAPGANVPSAAAAEKAALLKGAPILKEVLVHVRDGVVARGAGDDAKVCASFRAMVPAATKLAALMVPDALPGGRAPGRDLTPAQELSLHFRRVADDGARECD